MVNACINQYKYTFIQVDTYGCLNEYCLFQVNEEGGIILFAPISPMISSSSVKNKYMKNKNIKNKFIENYKTTVLSLQ